MRSDEACGQGVGASEWPVQYFHADTVPIGTDIYWPNVDLLREIAPSWPNNSTFGPRR
jgi:hypothetical protein